MKNIKESSDLFFKDIIEEMEKNKEKIINSETQEEEETINKESG